MTTLTELASVATDDLNRDVAFELAGEDYPVEDIYEDVFNSESILSDF